MDRKIMERPGWDEYFMKQAFVAAERSPCFHHHVGAITVRDKRVLTTGYNCSVAGGINCCDLGYCNKEKMAKERGEVGAVQGKGFDDCYAIHAEENAILQGGKMGVSVEGSTMYITHQPCSHCADKIIQVGIEQVKYVFPYADKNGIDRLAGMAIMCEMIQIPSLEISFLE